MIKYNDELLISVKDIMIATGIRIRKEIEDLIATILTKDNDIVDYIKKDGEYFLSYIGAYKILEGSNIDCHKIDKLFY